MIYGAQIRHWIRRGHAVDMSGAWILQIKSDVSDTIRPDSLPIFEVSSHHSL